MKRLLLTIVSISVLSACDDSPTEADPRERVIEIQVASETPRYAASEKEIPVPLQFRAVDELGEGVAGVRIEFSTWEDDGGHFSVEEAITDADGYVETRYTTGPVTGSDGCQLQVLPPAGSPSETAPCASLNVVAELPGSELLARVSTSVIRMDQLRLTPDVLETVADGQQRDGGFDAAALDPEGRRFAAIDVEYLSQDTTILALRAHTGSSATFRGQRRGFVPKLPGITKVVATFAGVSDTAIVEVAPVP
jgi:hypothetical protein